MRSYRKFVGKNVVTLLICGYLVGVALIVGWHTYAMQHAGKPKSKLIVWTVAVLILFIFGYSRSVRCIFTLCIPIMCSSKGRTLLMALAFLLAATGPIWNLLRNTNILMRSLSCGEAQLKEALEEMLDLMKQPLVAIKDAIKTAMQNIRVVMRRVEVFLLRMKELVMVILAAIKNAFKWLGNIVSICNKELGTPFDRCMRVADNAMADCRKKLGVFKGLCHATHLFSMLCYTVKVFDVMCIMIVFLDDNIIGAIMEKLREFSTEIKNMFDVSITFDHDFTFKTVASRNLTEVASDIAAEINARMNNFVFLFGWLDIACGYLGIIVIIKAAFFKMKYLKNLSYQNRYITKEFVEFDEQREGTDRDRALPLKTIEKWRYVWLSSCRLTRPEIMLLLRSMLFMAISSAQLFCICLTDYSLYWILAMINYIGGKVGNVEIPPFITVDVNGGGFVGDVFRGIVHAFEPLSQKYNIDATPCLPVPKVPNYKRYSEIAGLCGAAWLLLFCQPYALRLRHIVMRLYYPDEARKRAAWLYNEILLKRVSLFKLMRRKARSKFLNKKEADPYRFIDWLRVKTSRFCLFRCLLGRRKADTCIICGSTVYDDKIQCGTIGCNGVFCESCYAESNNKCCICQKPIDYGDDSDISEVKDSSDEPEEMPPGLPPGVNFRRVHESDRYCVWVP